MPDELSYLADFETPILIGEVANITGATRKAIRHYEEIGLIPEPIRRGTYRTYTSRHVFMIHVIRHAQNYGFSLNEVRQFVGHMGGQKDFPVSLAIEKIRLKQSAIQQEMERLNLLDEQLESLITDIKKNFT